LIVYGVPYLPNATAPCKRLSRLGSLRRAAGLSQRRLACEAGISRDTIVRAEHGVGTITLASAKRIAAVLGASVDEVFG
jgi:transcriptional regulator with XRE-family HTH domain